MTLCDNCGSRVTPGDAFCGVCGAYLDWHAAEAPVGNPAPPSTAPAATPERVSEPGPAPEPDSAAGADPVDEPEPVDEPKPADAARPPVVDRANRAAPLVVPVTEAPARASVRTTPQTPARASGADQPGAVQPGRPLAPRPVLREFTDTDTTGQVACPACGTPNPFGRSFCRHCGSAMAAAPPAERSRRRWRIRWPRGRGRLRRLLALLLVLVLLAFATWAAVRWGPRAVDAVRDRLAKPVLTTPARTSASSSAPGHGPELVSDGLSNRYWSPGPDGTSGQWVELGFDQPIRVLTIIISGGVSQAQDEYLRQGRPAVIVVSTWTSGDVRTDRDLQLADRAGPQTFAFTAGDTTRLRVTITSGYALSRDHGPAIAEIEVFRRP